MNRRLLLMIFLSGAVCASAQQVRVRTYTAPLEGTVILKDVEDKYNARVINFEMPEPDADDEQVELAEIKERSAKMFPHRRQTYQRKTTAAPAPTVVIGFVADSLTGIPPDNDMAISKQGKAISVVNTTAAVLDGQTGVMTYRKGLKQFSSTAKLNDIFNDYRYDPKVIYDPDRDRFICVMLNSTDEYNYIVVGFSLTNDPAGAWNYYKFKGDYKSDTTWFDYPCIAITKNEFFLTGNKIHFNTPWQTGFTETVIYQIDKQSGFDSAANITYQIWDGIAYNGKSIRNLYPVKGGAGIGGPEQYFLSNRNFDIQNDTIFLVKLPDVISSGNHNLSVTALKSSLTYGVPPTGRQPDTSATLATNDGRILGAFSDGDEIQFVSTSVHPVNGGACVYHGKIANYKTNPAVTAQYITVDTLDFGYPNVTYTGNPWGLVQSLISFNYTGPNIYPGMGAVLFDGAQYSDVIRVKEGTGSIKLLSQKEQRWGDYMGAQVDWNATGSVWIEGIFGRADNRYGNWMAKLNSPLLAVKDKQTEVSAASVYPNPAWQFIRFGFELKENALMTFAIYNMNGQLVDHILKQRCAAGANEVQFNIAALAAGTYYLKATDDKGHSIIYKSFIRQ